MARHTRQESVERSLRPAAQTHPRLSYARGEVITYDRFLTQPTSRSRPRVPPHGLGEVARGGVDLLRYLPLPSPKISWENFAKKISDYCSTRSLGLVRRISRRRIDGWPERIPIWARAVRLWYHAVPAA